MNTDSRRMRWAVSIVAALTLAEVHASRDPFLLPEKVCQAPVSAFDWQLMGIIGREGRFLAWLKPAQGVWVQRQQNESLDDDWKISQVRPLSVQLFAMTECEDEKILALDRIAE